MSLSRMRSIKIKCFFFVFKILNLQYHIGGAVGESDDASLRDPSTMGSNLMVSTSK